MKLKEMTSAQIDARIATLEARMGRWSCGDDLLDLFDPQPGLGRLGALWATLHEARDSAYLGEMFDDCLPLD